MNPSRKNNELIYNERDVAGSLKSARSGNQENYVIHNTWSRSGKSGKGGTGKLSKADGSTYAIEPQDKNRIEIKKTNNRIRRLTPIECERLQGFPDNWTAKGDFDGEVKDISDTQRYKLMGNAVSTPVVKAIGMKLKKVLSKKDY